MDGSRFGDSRQAAERQDSVPSIRRWPCHVLVTVQAEACIECGEPYYSADTLKYFERLREQFARNELVVRLVGNVYEMP